MTTFQKTVLAAIVKSLLRGKSLIQAILSYWITPFTVPSNTKGPIDALPRRSPDQFLAEAESLFLGSIALEDLHELSRGLMKQFKRRLQKDPTCMLPSYSHQLPRGTERGRFLALDVGGSTLRVALVELRGRMSKLGDESEILSMRSFPITSDIKDLVGLDFFDWMAARIAETLAVGPQDGGILEKPLPMALAWSFPIEQTSLGGGKLQIMGKGFSAYKGLMGRDLGDILKKACTNHGLSVELQAIINDSSACLLSQAYTHASTRFGLILGTGVNIAAFLPVLAIGATKLGDRPASWFDEASHCVVNSEIGMFGHDILPLTRWDEQLLQGHSNPGLQPLEHFVSGMYLGEICRFALLEAIETTGIFGGVVPASLKEPYSLSTETLSMVQSDPSPEFATSCNIFSQRHPSAHTPSASDMAFVNSLASMISQRSSALVAATVFTFSTLRVASQAEYVAGLPSTSPRLLYEEADRDMRETTVAFNGSVIESYPGYLATCQKYLDDLVASCGAGEDGRGSSKIKLVAARESSLMGAAVALASLQGEA